MMSVVEIVADNVDIDLTDFVIISSIAPRVV